MSGLEKIVEDIRSQSQAAAAGVIAEADRKADSIRRDARKAAEESKAQLTEEGKRAAAEYRQRSDSACVLKQKQRVLVKKQELIKKVMEEALTTAKGLPADRYFAMVSAMILKSAHKDEPGEICFAQSDLDRLPDGFITAINEKLGGKAVLTVSDKPVTVDGGCILRYNGIEENCSFAAVLSERKEELQDKIKDVLFS